MESKNGKAIASTCTLFYRKVGFFRAFIFTCACEPFLSPRSVCICKVHTDADTHARTLTRLEQELQGINSL